MESVIGEKGLLLAHPNSGADPSRTRHWAGRSSNFPTARDLTLRDLHQVNAHGVQQTHLTRHMGAPPIERWPIRYCTVTSKSTVLEFRPPVRT